MCAISIDGNGTSAHSLDGALEGKYAAWAGARVQIWLVIPPASERAADLQRTKTGTPDIGRPERWILPAWQVVWEHLVYLEGYHTLNGLSFVISFEVRSVGTTRRRSVAGYSTIWPMNEY